MGHLVSHYDINTLKSCYWYKSETLVSHNDLKHYHWCHIMIQDNGVTLLFIIWDIGVTLWYKILVSHYDIRHWCHIMIQDNGVTLLVIIWDIGVTIWYKTLVSHYDIRHWCHIMIQNNGVTLLVIIWDIGVTLWYKTLVSHYDIYNIGVTLWYKQELINPLVLGYKTMALHF